jgi:hypothetical protein
MYVHFPNWPELHTYVSHLISWCTPGADEIAAECRRNADLHEAEVVELTRSGQKE